MRNDTRKEILGVAKKLFNERGYNNVSTRDIANVLDISKGNLTYYFKKKEDIIEALLTEAPNTRVKNAPRTLEELNFFFEDMQKIVQENAFYFWHYTQFAEISSTIQNMQFETLNENQDLLEKTMLLLKEAGLVKEEQYVGEYKRLIDTLLLSCIYWVQFGLLKKTAEDNFLIQAWSIMYPFLSAAGIEALNDIVSPEWFSKKQNNH